MKEILNESNNSENEKKKFISQYDREEKEKLVAILKSLENNLNKKKDESIIEVYGKFAKNSNDFLKKEIKRECNFFFLNFIFLFFYWFFIGIMFVQFLFLKIF